MSGALLQDSEGHSGHEGLWLVVAASLSAGCKGIQWLRAHISTACWSTGGSLTVGEGREGGEGK